MASASLNCGLSRLGMLILLPLSLAAAEPASRVAAAGQPNTNPDAPLTLRQALSLALAQNPELAVIPHELRALEARELQAGLRPNPEIGVTVENVLGTGSVRAFSAAETTLQLSQVIELGGKRLARAKAVESLRNVTAADYEVLRVDVLSRTAVEFVHAIRAQEEVRLTGEQVALAEDVARTVAELVAQGKVSPIEETRARSAVSAVTIERANAGHELTVARARLAALWGVREPRFASVQGDLYELNQVAPFSELANRLAETPELKRWSVELSRRHADLSLAEARRLPDVTVSGGVRHLSGPKDAGFVLGLSIPLNVFDRKQGERAEADARIRLGGAEQESAELRLFTELRVVHERLQAARSEAAALKDELIPAATTTLAAISEGYRNGKFAYLDLLDAQRSLFAVRQQQVQAAAVARLALIELERLLGSSAAPETLKP